MSDTPYRIPDDDFVDAVREATEDGATDDVEGGVPPSEVAARLDIDERNARRRLDKLAENHTLVTAIGVNSASKRRRKGYLCPEHIA